MTQPLLHVAIAALARRASSGPRLLLTRRRTGAHLARCWELPGGKVEAGESPLEALSRELAEELNWTPPQAALERSVSIRPVTYDYPDRTVTLYAFLIQPTGRELAILDDALTGIEHRWVAPGELDRLDDLPPANAPIHRELQRRLDVSDRPEN